MERAKSDGILPEGFDVKDDNSAVKPHARVAWINVASL